MSSDFAGTFIEYTLTYTVRSGAVTTDAAGNEVEETTAATVRAFLKTPRAPNVQAQIGADTVRVDYEGRLTDPVSPPAGFLTGTQVTFVMDGRTVTGRVKVFAPSPIEEVEKSLGRKIQVNANG